MLRADHCHTRRTACHALDTPGAAAGCGNNRTRAAGGLASTAAASSQLPSTCQVAALWHQALTHTNTHHANLVGLSWSSFHCYSICINRCIITLANKGLTSSQRKTHQSCMCDGGLPRAVHSAPPCNGRCALHCSGCWLLQRRHHPCVAMLAAALPKSRPTSMPQGLLAPGWQARVPAANPGEHRLTIWDCKPSQNS
jgi:hypothetical protein